MDLAHLVYTGLLRAVRSPAVHFVVIGVALRIGLGPPAPVVESTQLVVSGQEIARAKAEFAALQGRPPTGEESQALVEFFVDREVLFQYALQMGLHEQPVVRRRLAQIAAFVASNPHEPTTPDERADEALALGLHRGDLIVRRILIDGARRLIRAPWLVRAPDDETLRGYLDAHPEDFQIPEEVRFTQVAVNGLKHGETTARRAEELVRRLGSEGWTPDDAVRLGDPLPVASNLPPLSRQEIERKLGHRFASALEGAPTGVWIGPVSSRFGRHAVWVHERVPPRVPPLDQVRARVRRRFLQGLADDWLALRLAQLRSGFEVVIAEGEGDPAGSGVADVAGSARREEARS